MHTKRNLNLNLITSSKKITVGQFSSIAEKSKNIDSFEDGTKLNIPSEI